MPLRIVAIKKLCRLGVGTAEDLANILLNSLTPILLEYESMANEQGQGALQTVWSLSYFHPPQEYKLRFLDDLARQRDQLWMKERIMEDPTVAALNQGWSRGLPVQFLYPSMEWATAAVANAESAPFMASRVKDVVFCDVDVVLMKVQQSDTAAIGPFCDSLPFAMRAYIGGKHQVDREARLLKIWEHYSSPKWTSTSHIQKFKTWLMDFAKLCKFTHAVAVLDPLEYATPHYENFFATGPGPMEWDPRPRGSKYPEEHAQSSSTHSTDDSSYTLLQCRFHTAMVSWVSRGSAFQRPSPWQNLSGRDKLAIWKSDTDMRRLPVQTREAMVLSAILFLDAILCTGSTRLLSKPFPKTASRPRYPAVYLDYEFLSEASSPRDGIPCAVQVLQNLVQSAPPTLLHALASSLLTTMATPPDESQRNKDLLSTTMAIIKLLPLSDNPELGVDIGLDVIKKLPDASAWYRQVVSLRLARQVQPECAESMLKKFGSVVLGELEKQNTIRESQIKAKNDAETDIERDKEGAAAPKNPSPFVKITTIKLLAQLLAKNNFASFGISIEILRSLFTASRQIDVRHAVVDGVLALLKQSGDMELQAGNTIYATFTSFSTAASCPSERDTVSEDMWLRAEAGEALPEVTNDRPLLDLFLTSARRLLPERFQLDYARNVVLQLLDESTKQHNRWMRIFLSRIELTPDEASVKDFGPFGDDAIGVVLTTWNSYLPRDYLVRHRSWALSYLDCRKLENISDKLDERGKGWRDTNAGEHWERYFKYHQSQRRGFDVLVSLIIGSTPSEVKSANGITKDHLMHEYCIRAALVACNPFTFVGPHSSVSLKPFESVYELLSAKHRTNASSAAVWRKYLRPLLKRIVTEVEALRSNDWLDNPNRNPVILPPQQLLSVLPLLYPHVNDLEPQRYKIFAEEIHSLVSQCAESLSCISEFVYVQESMDLVTPSDCVPCALAIGRVDIREHSQAVGCLKLQLVNKLLDRVDRIERGKSEEVAGMIKPWKESPSEWVRSLAWKLHPTP